MIYEKIINCNDLSLESYNKFLNSKLSTFYHVKNRKITIKNIDYDIEELNNNSDVSSFLFDYQKFIVNLALQKQRFAIFSDCGTGKTNMFLEFIRKVKKVIGDKKILIISPLMVIEQTIMEEKKFFNCLNIKNLHRSDLYNWIDEGNSQIGIINYDKFHKTIDFKNKIGCVVLDESSILKNSDGVTRNSIIESFRGVPFKLCCSATPAPNDRQEYANHSTFLEYTRSNNEFFSKFFVNKEKDKGGWQIKPHGLQSFYKELSNWSVYLRNPEHYGFVNNIKELPKPEIIINNLEWTEEQKKYLSNDFLGEISKKDLFSRRNYYLKLSRGFIKNNDKFLYIDNNKINRIIEIIKSNPKKQIMIWTVFNEEEKNIKEQLIKNNIKVDNISGSTQEERRGEIINRFRNKKFQVLISKPKILGFGINLEFCSIQIFSGITDSYEQFYQAIRRSYRYGATEQLKVFIPVTKAEKTILENVLKKKDTFDVDSLNQETNFVNNLKNDLKKFKGEIIMGETKLNEVQENYKEDENWKIYLADSIIKMEEFKNESIDFSIFSPPFASLFTYSEKLGDIGNSRDGNEEEFNLHMEFFLKRLFNVMKKNRNVCCHVQQLCTYKGLDGYVGTKDFRGLVIELFKKHGFIFFGEFVIKKNPQAQAIRNKVRSLSFSQMEQDRSGIRPGFNDYVLIFKKLGDNNDIINDETGPTRDEWINWAAGVWTDIKETDTLNTKKAKGEDDVKHVCPLQLEVIRRCIRMYTNKGDTVLDPFNGIGSSGVVALELQRKYIGIELKPEYFNESIKNFKKAKLLNIDSIKQESLRKKMKSDDVINSKSLFEF